MNAYHYIYARRVGKAWLAVAAWEPDCNDTCLALAADAFRLAGHEIMGTTGGPDERVALASEITRQKNFRPRRDMPVYRFTVQAVRAHEDLERAKRYIAQGWNLNEQPEAKEAAIRAGLIPA